jgi:cobalt-zinc-cadmium resistance protein CzcA
MVIDRLIALCIRQRHLVVALTALMAAAGVLAFLRLPLDAIPDLTNNQVQVITASPNLAPLEIEQLITRPLETVLNNIPRVTQVRSISRFGLSHITVIFEDGADIYWARQQVQERVQAAAEEIPEGLGRPFLGPLSTGLGEIYQYTVEGESHTLMERRTFQDWYLKRQLLTVPGVAEVSALGGDEKQFQVIAEPSLLVRYGIGLGDIAQAIGENNANAGGGPVAQGAEQSLLRGEGFLRGIPDLERVPLGLKGGIPFRVRDVARVVEGPAARHGAASADGRGEAVVGVVLMQKGANSREVVKRVSEKIREIEPGLPEGMTLRTFYDRSQVIGETLKTVRNNLLEGGLLVVAVLFFFLREWRSALLVAMLIPLSMLFAVQGMWILGLSGNLMSLGAIDFGMVVDGAVVLVENFMRRFSDKRRQQGHEGHLATVESASRQMIRPIAFGVLIIILVYLPILSLSGTEGKTFRPMAITVILALLGALILTVTFVPAAAALFLRREGEGSEPAFLKVLEGKYRGFLTWSFAHTRKILGGAVLAVLAAALAFPFLGSEFLPRMNEGSLAMQMIRLPSISLEESLEINRRAEEALMEFPEVVSVVSKTGSAEVSTDPMGVDTADVYIGLKPVKEWKTARTKDALIQAFSRELEKVPGTFFSFSQPIEMLLNCIVSGIRSDVAVRIYGDDLAVLKEMGDSVATLLAGLRGAGDVKAETQAGLPQITVRPDLMRLAHHALTVSDVNRALVAAGSGLEAGEMVENDRRFGIVVKLSQATRTDPASLERILIPAPDGSLVPLATVADLRVEDGPVQITREAGQRRMTVECNVRGRDLVGFVEEARRVVGEKLKMPPGYHVTWGGTFEQFAQARSRLLVVVPLTLMAIFVMLYFAFNSYRHALLVFTGIPFAAVGGVAALFIGGLSFSVSAGIGFIALFGVAVLNGIVMVSSLNEVVQGREDRFAAIAEGAASRLRPVLMTALVASLGFLPMALSTGTGAEIQKPLAVVVIGGLITSTILTLFVLPMLYRKMMSWTKREEV